MSTETARTGSTGAATPGSFNGAVDECRRRPLVHNSPPNTLTGFNGAVDECRRRRNALHRQLDPVWAASMEPSTNVDGDDHHVRRPLVVLEASMEPSTNVDGDRAGRGAPGTMRTLQWSRRRMSTETSLVRLAAEHGRGASMEPSTNVDGDVPRGSGAAAAPSGFNGAVDECRRRQGSWRTCVIGIKRFNGAVDECRRRHPRSHPSGSRTACFNGAVDECRRRPWDARRPSDANVVASMEPSTNVDGDSRMGTESSSRARSFNGAVDECRRRPAVPRAPVDGSRALQWSRRRMSTETIGFLRSKRKPCDASMEPSTNVDGDPVNASRSRSERMASMEPSTNVDGDLVDEDRVRITADASMEPSTNVDGDAASSSTLRRPCWRFNGAVDECRRRPTRRCSSAGRRASFNGAVDECRRRRSELELTTCGADASMEPSTNVDGDDP